MAQLDKRKLFWHSRRGMLELDLLLIPFLEQCFDHLTEQQQLLYRDLLANEDQDLFAWLMQRQADVPEKFEALIAQILENNSRSS